MRDFSKDINKWISLYKLSQAEREEKQPLWDIIDEYFRGTQWNSYRKEGVDIVTVDLIYSHVKVVVPSTYSRYPKIYFVPQNPASVEACRLLGAVLNADMRKMKLKDVNKRILQDVILYGTGFSKSTFEVEGDIETDNLSENDTADELMAKFKDTNIAAIGPEGLSGVVKTNPHLFRVNPRNLGFAVGATSIDDPGFIIHYERKRVNSLKNNPYYKNTSDLQATERISSGMRSALGAYAGYGAEEYLDYVDVYEVWDVDKQEYLTVADGHSKYLTEPTDNPYPVPHPFDRVVFTPLDGQMWGLGEIEPALPLFDELNKLRSQQINHIKRYNRKYLARENAFSSEEDQVRLESGEDGTVVKVRGTPGQPLKEIVAALDDAPMPADIWRTGVTIEDSIVKVTGTTPYRRGDIQGANTATEANLAENASQTQDSDRVDAMSEFTLSQLEKIRKMRAALTTGQEMIDITGNPLDINRWKYWTKEDIDLEAQMCIEIGSTRGVSEDMQKAEANQLYQLALANPTANPQAALTKLLESYGRIDIPDWFLPNQIIQIQMMIKALGQANEQKGISPQGGGQPLLGSGVEPGPQQPTNTPAEVAGRPVQKQQVA